jgi:nucleoside 2-deoxyribosyltransferase
MPAIPCPLCNEQAMSTASADARFELTRVQCPVCGLFQMDDLLIATITQVAPVPDRLKAAEVIYEQNVHSRRDPRREPVVILTRRGAMPARGFPYNSLVLEDLIEQFPGSVSERLERGLIALVKVSPTPGTTIAHDFKLQRLLFSENIEAMNWLLEQYASDGLIARPGGRNVQVTAKGWSKVAELERERGRKSGRRGFIAMTFSPADVRDLVRPAVLKGVADAGYEPILVDALEHNEKICDQIVAEIRKSRFVVADFTMHKQNVYFEAGFALGLGLPVIWTCRETDITKAHFDTRQYNHIVWATPEELSSRLTQRIMATVA